ncbi:hypothetical protein M409DRAFT_65092 [Zasmidium cellare ATCC 36951]|uniref:Zn(2)-C6 fungal-type domain-containing protein n=1 Tax=Zasmidium cellare ATCC 36951 TaxID=1080233 RepID=A0A6A6CRU2_ZASCE|nr:uncharacterized protein M409DRAFT_65092 [Zasmidium cellare ATCC 36951]KAF2169423.1 hypothetical protein M409DRAFT_65092 [Zasmidium cellare ATCC 36951]
MQPARKRQRTTHACDFCRTRKTRCDGNQPCETCTTLQQECLFGSEPNTKGKSDLILESVLRVEQALQDLNQNISRNSTQNDHGVPPPIPSAASLTTPATHPGDSAHEGNEVENAVLDSMHTSTTEAVLQWPHFDEFPSLRDNYVSIFQLEHQRTPLELANTTMQPYIGDEETDDLMFAFEQNINFWYPTMSQDQLDDVRKAMHGDSIQADSVDGCLTLLTLALGCASQIAAGLVSKTEMSTVESRIRSSRRKLGNMFFSSALKRIFAAHMEVSPKAAQCLLFTALYFASLTRPLQAREYLTAACSKCLLLVSYLPDDEDQTGQERTRRVFWSCYILESDYLAELSACPPSGISRVESLVSLPQTYNTHASQDEEEQASLYFLACISMRRLLNRVHQLLYAHDTGAAQDMSRFPYVVAELNHQLDEWRDVLPGYFSFTVDLAPAANERAAFLRQRYLTCRSVIYRPYLMWLLGPTPSSAVNEQDVLANCKICLDSCVMHILNLGSFAHTLLVDSWICSLSMAGAMLLLLAAHRVSGLRSLLGPELYGTGEHLQSLLGSWAFQLHTSTSPSVVQSIRIIREADKFIKTAESDGWQDQIWQSSRNRFHDAASL